MTAGRAARPTILAAVAALALACASADELAVLQAGLAPPPRPLVEPRLPSVDGLDADHDRIDDRLQRAPPGDERERVEVQLVFSGPVESAHLARFLEAGGEVRHLFRAVSYGWTGRLPRRALERLPDLLGPSLVAIVEAVPV